MTSKNIIGVKYCYRSKDGVIKEVNKNCQDFGLGKDR